MSTNLTPAQLTTDRVVSIVLMCVGVLLTIVWAPISLMLALISDAGMNFVMYLGLYVAWFGPFIAVVVLGIITIVKIVRKQRSMIFGILAGAAPIVMAILGIVIAQLGTLFPTGA